MEIVAFKGEKRSDLGKRATKAIRNAERIPCVLYGGDEVIHFSTTFNDVRDLIFTPDFKTAKIDIDGTAYQCILKDVQWHPVTEDILHIDFLRLVEGQSIKVEIPLRFKGVSPGVKSGGKLEQKLRRAKIKTTPEHLVDEIRLDISGLEMHDSLRIRDIEPGEGIEVLNSPGVPIASVVVPRAMRSAATKALPGEELPEGEEGVEGEEGEEGAEATAEE